MMNTFVSVQCSKNDVRVRSVFDRMVFDPLLDFDAILVWLPLRTKSKVSLNATSTSSTLLTHVPGSFTENV